MQDLDALRKKIDAIDQKVIEFLNDRTKLALEIGKLKGKTGRGTYAPDREYEIYQKIETLAKGPLSSDSLKSVYREIMSAALALEKELRIAYLGPQATFTHIASLSKFGSSVNYVPCTSISDVFSEVDKKRADYGVIPVENSTEGAVTHSYDMFIDSDLKICSEIIYEISHHLLSNSQLKSIKRVYSNPQVFGQCRVWIETNLPKVELIDTSSTSFAAQKAASEDGSAAIASRLAGTLNNLNVVAEDIQDTAHNQTRFIVIGHEIARPTGNDKTSIVLSIKDKVGALYEMLEPIRKNKINMTKIESRPSKKKAWDYYFFIDLVGHAEDKKIKKTLDEVEQRVRFLKVLGSYPAVRGKSSY
jgi:chorismate mutase/prephenate dehydratase